MYKNYAIVLCLCFSILYGCVSLKPQILDTQAENIEIKSCALSYDAAFDVAVTVLRDLKYNVDAKKETGSIVTYYKNRSFIVGLLFGLQQDGYVITVQKKSDSESIVRIHYCLRKSCNNIWMDEYLSYDRYQATVNRVWEQFKLHIKNKKI